MNPLMRTILGRPKKRPSYLTTLFCLDCEHLYPASCITSACPRCSSGAVIAAARWAPAKYGMPRLTR